MSQDWIQFVNTAVVPVGLMLIMFSLGLTLALRDFALVVRNPLLVGAGFATHLLVLPLLGLAIGCAVPRCRRRWRSACSSSRSARPAPPPTR